MRVLGCFQANSYRRAGNDAQLYVMLLRYSRYMSLLMISSDVGEALPVGVWKGTGSWGEANSDCDC